MMTKVSKMTIPHRFPSLGPALMISMGYIDLGKWVAAVEAGARFGFDLVLLVFFFNCTAIFCQYLSTCIGMATGKNLAEICSEEYSKLTCILLGVQAEISMIASELTMILGIAYGLSLLFGMELFTCILLAAVCSVLLPLFLTLWDNFKAEALYIGIAGTALVFYVLGVLISQPEFPLDVNGIFPRLSGESAYSLMALLGANIMVHNFYIHSSVVQQGRLPNVSMGSLFNDHFFAILSIFTGIFLVNYVLMNSAAAVFSNGDAELNFQDLNMVMDQIFRSPIAPLAFFLVLFFSSQVTALNWSIGGQVILRCFFGINESMSVHHALVTALAIIPALYFARTEGAEGLYQLLLLCQIILAMLLPSSVIPLFRVASSKFIMGAFKIPWYMEILALFVFLGMLASNAIFGLEILFGSSNWISNLQAGMGSSILVPYIIIFLVAFISTGLMLYLAVTPLRSASERPDTQMVNWNMQRNSSELSEVRELDDLDKITYKEVRESTSQPPAMELIEDHSDKSTVDVSVDSDHDSHHSGHDPNSMSACTSATYDLEKAKTVVDTEPEETMDKVSVCRFPDMTALQKIESKDPIEKDIEVSTNIRMDKNIEEGYASQPEDISRGILPIPAIEGPSLANAKGKLSDGNNGPGSLSKLSGLGRAARRQLSAILDEFWGHLFDFYGKLTPEASTRKLDVLLGLDLKTFGSSVKPEIKGDESNKSYFLDMDRGSIFQPNSRAYNSPIHKREPNLESSFGLQMGTQSYSQNMQTMDTHAQSAYMNMLESNERHPLCPQSADNWDYQPATIHGYQIASYLRGMGTGRNPYSSSISVDLPPTSTSFTTNHRDLFAYGSGQNKLGSLGISGFQNHPNKLQVERSYYEPSLAEIGENTASPAYAKKYHSSPDISAVIASIRNSSLNDGNAQWPGPIGSQPSVSRMGYEQSPFLNHVSRAGGPLAFDELSPPKLHRDIFSPHLTLNSDTKSLWSRQPFDQLFGVIGKDSSRRERIANRPGITSKDTFSYSQSETRLLQYLRFCIMKLLKLEGSDWLFRQSGGLDEELIDRLAAREKSLHDADSSEMNQVNMLDHQRMLERKNFCFDRNEEGDPACLLSLTNCGDGCVWRATIVVSFGIWCIRRILELSVVESRPELWGKYTYVLNRLQGILEPAFIKPRDPLTPCSCMQIAMEPNSNAPAQNGITSKGSVTTASMVLEMIKDAEAAVSGRKGRTGTAAGDVAFPKGKENLVSVLKRYKRRLSSKPPATSEGNLSAQWIPSPISSNVL